MKKYSLLIILVILNVLLVSCGNKKLKKVAILIYDESDTFMKEYSKELTSRLEGKVYYEVSYAQNNQANQNASFNHYLDENYDAIIINISDRLSSRSLIEKADKKKIPVIFINREPNLSLVENSLSYYVGANSRQQGLLQSQIVFDMLNDKNVELDKNNDNIIQIVILKGEQSHQDAEVRTIEFINGLIELEIKYELLNIKVGNWNRETAYLLTKELYEKHNNIELIVSNNDDMGLGAIDYLKEIKNDHQKQLDSYVIGVDATEEGKKSIEEGYLYATVGNDYLKQTEYIDKLIDYLLFNKKDPKINYESKYVLIDGNIYYK